LEPKFGGVVGGIDADADAGVAGGIFYDDLVGFDRFRRGFLRHDGDQGDAGKHCGADDFQAAVLAFEFCDAIVERFEIDWFVHGRFSLKDDCDDFGDGRLWLCSGTKAKACVSDLNLFPMAIGATGVGACAAPLGLGR
jgi:hypothetical protein